MRTTINLPDSLGEQARRRAAEQGRTFTSLVEEGLRAVLSEPRSPTSAVELPVFGDPDGEMLIDISDADALQDVLDGDGWTM